MQAASNTARAVDHVFWGLVISSVILLAIITGCMLYFAIRYNRKHTKTVTNIEGNVTLEWVFTLVPLVIVMGMFFFGKQGFDVMARGPKDALEIKVKAVQFAWTFTYPNGAVDPLVMRLPVNKPIKFSTTSGDVIHSFYIPAFRIKKDAVPGRENHVYVTPEKIGEYEIFCTEYCGLLHSKMIATVKVVSQEEFDKWYVANAAKEVKVAPGTDPEVAKLINEGKTLATSNGCIACHSPDGTAGAGPTWKGLFDHDVTVTEGGAVKTVKADEAYIISSIKEPGKQVVQGFQNVMPVQNLNDEQIKAITEYIKTLK